MQLEETKNNSMPKTLTQAIKKLKSTSGAGSKDFKTENGKSTVD
jgi:hypothetical protein